MKLPNFPPPIPTDPTHDHIPTASPVKKPKRKFQFRYQQPSVANYIARVVILNHLDYERAIEQIEPSLSTEEVEALSVELQGSEIIRNAVEKQLSAKGLDETSAKIFIEELWNRFWNGEGKDKEIAARLLGKAFIAEKIDLNKPEDLPISGFREGIKEMLSEAPTDEKEFSLSELN